MRITTDDVHAYIVETRGYGSIIELGRDNIGNILYDFEDWYAVGAGGMDKGIWNSFVSEVYRLEQDKDGYFLLIGNSGASFEVISVLDEAELLEEFGEDTAKWLGKEQQEAIDALSLDTIMEYISEQHGYGYMVELGRDNLSDIVADLADNYPTMLNNDWCLLGVALREYEKDAEKSGKPQFLELTINDPKLEPGFLYTEEELREDFGEDTLEWLDEENDW